MNNEKVKEIKKALECCANCNGQSSCKDCPIVEKCYQDENLMPRLALTLINELESENERLLESCKNCHYIKDLEIANGHAKELKDRIAELEKENGELKQHITEVEKGIINIAKERNKKEELASKFIDSYNDSLKQFSERLKKKFKDYETLTYKNNEVTYHNLEFEIDETLKELEELKNER